MFNRFGFSYLDHMINVCLKSYCNLECYFQNMFNICCKFYQCTHIHINPIWILSTVIFIKSVVLQNSPSIWFYFYLRYTAISCRLSVWCAAEDSVTNAAETAMSNSTQARKSTNVPSVKLLLSGIKSILEIRHMYIERIQTIKF